jgi:hypothetical protein
MNFAQLSSNITDLPGVEGLCLLDQQGSLLFRRMPAFIPDACYEEAVRRIIGLYETIDENFLPADDYALRFTDKWLVLRRTGSLILVIMTTEAANLSSLRMVTNLTLRHLQSTPAIADELRKAPPTAPTTPPAAPAPAARLPAAPAAPAPAATATPAAPAASSTAPAPAAKASPSSIAYPVPAPTPLAAKPKPPRMYRGQLIVD